MFRGLSTVRLCHSMNTEQREETANQFLNALVPRHEFFSFVVLDESQTAAALGYFASEVLIYLARPRIRCLTRRRRRRQVSGTAGAFGDEANGESSHS
jgi:hypothetical protein